MKRIINERPIVFFVAFFVLGILLANELSFSVIVCNVCAIACIAGFVFACVKKKTYYFRILYALAFFVGASLFTIQYNIDYTGINNNEEYVVNARICDVERGDYSRYTLCDVVLTNVDIVEFDKKVFLYSTDRLEYGDIISFTTTVTLPSTPRNPGAFDEKMYLAANGAGFSCFSYDISVTGNVSGAYGGLLELREHLAQSIDNVFTENTAQIAKAMFLGVGDLDQNVYDDFAKTGMAHVLAISGLHIGIIAMAINYLLKKLKVSRNLRFSLTIGILVFYALITGLPSSVVRAVVMSTIILIGRWKFFKADVLSSLAIAMILTLIWQTPQLFMPGFIMSYATVFGILCLSPPFVRWLESKKVPKNFAYATAISCVASLAIAPLSAYYFGGISFLGPILNFVVIPLASIIVVSTAIFLMFGRIAFRLAVILAIIPQVTSALLLGFNEWVANTGVGYLEIKNESVLVGIVAFPIMFLSNGIKKLYCR